MHIWNHNAVPSSESNLGEQGFSSKMKWICGEDELSSKKLHLHPVGTTTTHSPPEWIVIHCINNRQCSNCDKMESESWQNESRIVNKVNWVWLRWVASDLHLLHLNWAATWGSASAIMDQSGEGKFENSFKLGKTIFNFDVLCRRSPLEIWKSH